MSSYLLIHSSGQGPEGYKLLAQELERRGHRILVPALRVDRTDEGLAWHTETLVGALEQSGFEPREVVMVAHSAGGMYLPLVAERWCPRRMVFLAAVIPRPGVSMMDQFRSDPSMMNPAWIGKNPMDDEVANGIYVARLSTGASRLGAVHARIVLCQTSYGGTLPTEKLAICSGELYFVRR